MGVMETSKKQGSLTLRQIDGLGLAVYFVCWLASLPFAWFWLRQPLSFFVVAVSPLLTCFVIGWTWLRVQRDRFPDALPAPIHDALTRAYCTEPASRKSFVLLLLVPVTFYVLALVLVILRLGIVPVTFYRVVASVYAGQHLSYLVRSRHMI